MLEDSTDAVLIHRDDLVIWANAPAAQLLGFASAHEMMGFPVSALVAEESRPSWGEHLGPAGATPGDADLRLITRAGGVLQVEVHSITIRFDGRAAVQTTVRDSLPVRELQRALDTYQLGASVVLDVREVGLLLVDGSGAIRESNSRSANLLGYSAFVLQSLDLATLCPDADAPQLAALRDALKHASRGAPGSSLELTVRHRSGRPMALQLELRPTHRPGRALVVLRAAGGQGIATEQDRSPAAPR